MINVARGKPVHPHLTNHLSPYLAIAHTDIRLLVCARIQTGANPTCTRVKNGNAIFFHQKYFTQPHRRGIKRVHLIRHLWGAYERFL